MEAISFVPSVCFARAVCISMDYIGTMAMRNCQHGQLKQRGVGVVVKLTRLSKLHGGLQASKSSSKQNKSVALDARILNDVDCSNIAYPVTASAASR